MGQIDWTIEPERLQPTVRLFPASSRFCSKGIQHRTRGRIRKAVDPYGEHADEEVCALLFFGDPQSDRAEYPSYLTSFIDGVVAAWEEKTHDVEVIKPTATDYLLSLVPIRPVTTTRLLILKQWRRHWP